MLVPILIFLVGMMGGAFASARWLPDLAVGAAGGLAFFVVCGLIGAAMGLVGLHAFLLVEELDSLARIQELSRIPSDPTRAVVMANAIRDMLFEAGSLIGFAAAIYLLAPPPLDDEDTVAERHTSLEC